MAMPVRRPEHWELIRSTAEWKSLKTELMKEQSAVATDLYYVNVSKE